MWLKTTKYALLLVGGLTFNNAMSAEISGELLAHSCAGCHGTNGVSAGPATPNIAGVSVDTIVESMEAYKEGYRPATVMDRIARGYSSEEIEAMADYFSKQTYQPAKQPFDDEKAKKGKELHDDYCDKCHEEGGRLDEDGASILAGQWKTYLEFEMADFLSRDRDMPKKMRRAIIRLERKRNTDEKIDQLIHYYISQQ